MVSNGKYTKEEMATALGITSLQPGHITRKLDTLKYKYTTEGRGEKYRIIILGKNTTLKEFTKDYLGIQTNSEEKLKYFFNFILTQKPKYLNMSFTSMEWYSPITRQTISEWMKAAMDAQLVIPCPNETIYYKTIKIKFYEDNNDDYSYYRHYKEATEEEYQQSEQVFLDAYNFYMSPINSNNITLKEEARYYASIDRIAAYDGWFIGRKKDNVKLKINTDWEHYEELLSLLGNRDEFQIYHRRKYSSDTHDRKERQKLKEKWAEYKNKILKGEIKYDFEFRNDYSTNDLESGWDWS